MTSSNPMNSRCGLEDCDCEYTIGGLLRRLEIVAEKCTAGREAIGVTKNRVFLEIAQDVKATVRQTRGICDAACEGSSCPCYVAGSEAERRPASA
jgi:hypothetical protein